MIRRQFSIMIPRKKSGTKTRASDPKVRYGVTATRSDSQDSVSGVYIGSGSGKVGGGGGGGGGGGKGSRYEEPEMRRVVPHDPQVSIHDTKKDRLTFIWPTIIWPFSAKSLVGSLTFILYRKAILNKNIFFLGDWAIWA